MKKRKEEKPDPVFGIDDEIENVEFVKHKIKKTPLPEGHEKVYLDNVVEVPEGVLEQIVSRTDFATRQLVALLLERSVPLAMSYDNATSYAEAVLRDGLSVDIEIDDDITKVIDQLGKLSVAYQYSRLVKLPKAIRRRFIEGLCDKFVEESVAQMKIAQNTRKYSQNLREVVAHVQSKKAPDLEEAVQNNVGVKKSRR